MGVYPRRGRAGVANAPGREVGVLRLCAVDEVVGRVDAEALEKLLEAGFVPLTGMWRRGAPLVIDGQAEERPNAEYHDGVVDDPSL